MECKQNSDQRLTRGRLQTKYFSATYQTPADSTFMRFSYMAGALKSNNPLDKDRAPDPAPSLAQDIPLVWKLAVVGICCSIE